MRILNWVVLATCAAISISPASGAESQPPGEVLLSSMRPNPKGRQEKIGEAIRTLKAMKLVPFRPQRRDYTDYYRVNQTFELLGHDVYVIEEEYNSGFIGCCVSEGGGFAVRLKGGVSALDAWAKTNKCSVEVFDTAQKFLRLGHLKFSLPDGRYAEVSCRYRDEKRWEMENTPNDTQVVRDVAARRAVSEALLDLASDIEHAGGTLESIRRGFGSASFRVMVEPSKVPAVTAALQSAEILGKGAIQEKTDPLTGKVILIAGGGLETPANLKVGDFSPVVADEWEKQLELANSLAMEKKLYFWRFFPVSTEAEKSLARVRVEVVVSGTEENLKRWVELMHSTTGSALVFDNVSLERRAGDPRGPRLSGDLFVYRKQ